MDGGAGFGAGLDGGVDGGIDEGLDGNDALATGPGGGHIDDAEKV